MFRLASVLGAFSVLAAASLPALSQVTPSPAPPADVRTAAPGDAKLYIIAPQSGARIRGAFAVQFGLRGMGVTQAGSTAPNAGHHHLLIDKKDPISPTEIIPADKTHVHFGAGQTEARIELPPGRHTLQLVLGDANHRPFQPMVASEKIEITVLGAQRKRPRPRRYY